MAVGLHSISKDDAQLIRDSGNTMKSKTLAVKSILGMAETWAKRCQLCGHSRLHVHDTKPRLDTMRLCYSRRLVTIKHRFERRLY
jgi:hypothetical protein